MTRDEILELLEKLAEAEPNKNWVCARHGIYGNKNQSPYFCCQREIYVIITGDDIRSRNSRKSILRN